jgi:lysophospholipid acyltransferase (LPLAT)-like uncharacterized protein
MSRLQSDPSARFERRRETSVPAAPQLLGSERPPIIAQMLGWAFAYTLRVMHSTWRTDVDALARLDELHAEQRPHIITFWHRKYVALFPLLRGRHACAVTTSATHGHIVACMCRHFGNHAVQISDQGRGAQSFRAIGHALARDNEGSIAVDGPHGPDHTVKRGAVQAASDFGHLLVPISVAARRKHVLVHRWDHLEIPTFFTRVSLAVGDPIRVPPNLRSAEIMRWRTRLHDALEAVDREAEAMVTRRDR